MHEAFKHPINLVRERFGLETACPIEMGRNSFLCLFAGFQLSYALPEKDSQCI